MKKILCIALVVLVGCKGKEKELASIRTLPLAKPATLIRAFSRSDNWDSLYLYSDGHLRTTSQDPPERYFLISYQTMRKNSHYPIVGCQWFASNWMPTKLEIDSMIYEYLELEKECYQGIVITNIHEFSANDFDDFFRGYPGDKKVARHKSCYIKPAKMPITLGVEKVIKIDSANFEPITKPKT